MVHKAPAAFGLVTFLLHEGLDRNRARKHLLIFSVSAPMLALITFICLSSGSEAIDGKVIICVHIYLSTKLVVCTISVFAHSWLEGLTLKVVR